MLVTMVGETQEAELQATFMSPHGEAIDYVNTSYVTKIHITKLHTVNQL